MNNSLRERQVLQMIEELAAEGMLVGQDNTTMLHAYVAGTMSGVDLLAHVHQFASMEAYHDWWLDYQETLVNNPNLLVSVEYVVAEFQDSVRRKHSDA